MLGFAVAAVLQPFLRQVRVDLGQVLRVAHPVVRLGHHPLAGAADGQDRQAHLLSLGEVTSVQSVAEKLVLFLDDAGAGASPAWNLLQLNPHTVAHHSRRWVKFGRAPLRHAAREKSVLHWLIPPLESPYPNGELLLTFAASGSGWVRAKMRRTASTFSTFLCAIGGILPRRIARNATGM